MNRSLTTTTGSASVSVVSRSACTRRSEPGTAGSGLPPSATSPAWDATTAVSARMHTYIRCACFDFDFLLLLSATTTLHKKQSMYVCMYVCKWTYTVSNCVNFRCPLSAMQLIDCTTEGDYNIQIPSETTDGMYKIRVGVFGDDSVYGCSDAFEVVSRDDNVAYTHEMSMGFSYSYSYSYAHSYEWI